MNLINIGKNRAVVKFNTCFYEQSSVTAALTKFWPIFNNQFNVFFTGREKPKYFTVILKPRNKKTIDRQEVYDFCNFALKQEIDSVRE